VTDQEVVARCLSGDRDAFAVLVERYGGRVYNLALRIVGDPDAASDCAQEAFVRAYRSLHRYDPAFPFGPWILKIATNTSRTHLRTWHAHQDLGGDVEERPEPEEAGPELVAVRREEVAEVLAAMVSLPPAYRAALTLRHMQQLSYQEVADALEVPIGTVKTHLHRARAALRRALAERRGRLS
jgi:RNA polymerase sigma-70 factor (ECF subfamily)